MLDLVQDLPFLIPCTKGESFKKATEFPQVGAGLVKWSSDGKYLAVRNGMKKGGLSNMRKLTEAMGCRQHGTSDLDLGECESKLCCRSSPPT